MKKKTELMLSPLGVKDGVHAIPHLLREDCEDFDCQPIKTNKTAPKKLFNLIIKFNKNIIHREWNLTLSDLKTRVPGEYESVKLLDVGDSTGEITTNNIDLDVKRVK